MASLPPSVTKSVSAHLPIPEGLASLLPYPRTPWLISPTLWQQLSKLSSVSTESFVACPVSQDTPEYRFVMAHFNNTKPRNFGVKRIDIIHSAPQTQAFESELLRMKLDAASPAFAPSWEDMEPKKLRVKTFSRWMEQIKQFSPIHVKTPKRVETCDSVYTLPLFHGTNRAASICANGLTYQGKHAYFHQSAQGGPNKSTDPGFFGSGIYGTNSADYASKYTREGTVVMGWFSMRAPFPVVSDKPIPEEGSDMQMLMGHGGFRAHNCHFIPVTRVYPKDEESLLFYACFEKETPFCDEFVVFHSSQSIVRFVIHLGVDFPASPSASVTVKTFLELILELLEKKQIKEDKDLHKCLSKKAEDLVSLDSNALLPEEGLMFYKWSQNLMDKDGKLRDHVKKKLIQKPVDSPALKVEYKEPAVSEKPSVSGAAAKPSDVPLTEDEADALFDQAEAGDAEALWKLRYHAELGEAVAQNNLGVLYDNGDGIPEDAEMAAKWYQKAVAQGYAQAQSNLADLFENGRGVPEDRSEAFKLYGLAAAQGHKEAQKALDEMQAHDGEEIEGDDVEEESYDAEVEVTLEKLASMTSVGGVSSLEKATVGPSSKPAASIPSFTIPPSKHSLALQGATSDAPQGKKDVVKEKDAFKNAPLSAASKILLASPTTVDEEGRNALHQAAMQGNIPVLRSLLASHRNLLESRDKRNNTPLILAVRNGQASACKILLGAGASPTAVSEVGRNALHWAYEGGKEVAKLVLAADKKLLNLQDERGDTTLILAVGQGQIELCEFLLEAKADTDIKGFRGGNVLHHANAKVLPLLLKRCMHLIESKDEFEYTPLLLHASGEHVEESAILLDAGANPNATIWDGKTLHQLIDGRAKKEAILKLLPTGPSKYVPLVPGLTTQQRDAVIELHRLAHRGDANAQCDLGVKYETGKEVPLDLTTARQWYELSANQGNVYAQLNLAWVHLYAKGVSKNEAMAFHWLDCASAQGNAEAQFNLAVLRMKNSSVYAGKFESGKTVDDLYKLAAKQGHVEAIKALKKDYDLGKVWGEAHSEENNNFIQTQYAKHSGDADLQFDVGLRLWHGKDFKEAAGWFNLAANQGHIGAQYFLKRPTGTFSAFVSDPSKQFIIDLKKLAATGDANAQYNMGWMYQHVLNEPGINRLDVASRLFDFAAKQGHIKAMCALGDIWAEKYEKSISSSGDKAERSKLYKAVYELFERAASKGFALAQLKLGDWMCRVLDDDAAELRQGKGAHEWKETIRERYELAAKQKCAPALMRLGERWKDGELWGLDYEKAGHWFKLAAAQVYPGARAWSAYFEKYHVTKPSALLMRDEGKQEYSFPLDE